MEEGSPNDIQHNTHIIYANTEPNQKTDIDIGKILSPFMQAKLLVFSPNKYHWSETRKTFKNVKRQISSF